MLADGHMTFTPVVQGAFGYCVIRGHKRTLILGLAPEQSSPIVNAIKYTLLLLVDRDHIPSLDKAHMSFNQIERAT